MEGSFLPMAMSIKDSGSTIRHTVKENTSMLRVPLIKGDGMRTNSKASVRRSGLMGPFTMVSTSEARSMEKASSNGPMVPNTRGTGKTTRCMAEENSSGLTVEFTKVST